MKKIILLLTPLLLVNSCFQGKNDLIHDEVVAIITAFEVEGQVSSEISLSNKSVTVTLPPGTDPSVLTVKKIEYTEGAVLSEEIPVGGNIDLSKPKEIVLTTYDPYKWTFSADVLAIPDEPDTPDTPDPDKELTKDGPQLYNMGFDFWYKDPDSSYDLYYPYGATATDEQKAIWEIWPKSLSFYDMPVVSPEFEFLAAGGENKAALKLTSGASGDKLAGGVMFNGTTSDFFPIFFDYKPGIPFTSRPDALELFACYKSKNIDHANGPYSATAGEPDKGHVIVLLTDWEEPFTVSPSSTLIDYINDPAIIGFGKVVFEGEMEEYERFQVNIGYRSDRTPRFVSIIIASSTRSDYFTGAVGSTLYVDELAFLYAASE